MNATATTTVRMARCTYYGRHAAKAGYSSTTCAAVAATPWEKRGTEVCLCEEPSDEGLAFFHPCPEKEYDEFVCGCQGWD